MCFYISALFSYLFHALTQPFYPYFDTQFQNSFSWTLFYFFLWKAQKFLETCINCKWNCVTPLFNPLEVPCSIFFSSNIPFSPLKCETCYEGDIWNISRRRIMDLKNHGPYKTQFCKKWVGELHFRENGLAITFTLLNEP